MDGQEIRNRYDQLVSLRKTLDQTYQYVERYVRPYAGEFFRPEFSEHEVLWRRRHIYDSTAPNSCNLLAAQMHSNLTSPSVKWFDLVFRDKNLQKQNTLVKWLEECSLIMWQALLESDFNLEAAAAYVDLCSFGSAFISEEEESEESWEGIDFSTVPIRESYFEPDAQGNIKRFYRRLQYTKLQMIDKWGEDKLPETLKTDTDSKDDGDVDRKYDIIFCIFERDAQKDANTSKTLKPELRPFGYKYIFHKDGSEIGKEGGYYEMPTFLARWLRVSGSRYGYSPAFVALSDILQLNEVVKQTSEARAKAIDPATFTTENGLISDLDLSPGGLTIVSSMEELQAFESRARFDQADAEIERLQRSIRQTYFIDKLELKDSPAMTATEVRVRYERMQRLLGPTLGRLQAEFLDPLLKRTFMILLRAGQFPTLPAQLEEVNLDIEYTGPLPRAQKTEQAESIEYYMGILTEVGQIYPDVLDTPNPDKVARRLAELRGVPADVLNDEAEVEKTRNERQQREAEMAQLEQAKTAGDALAKAGAGAKAMSEAPAAQEAIAAVG